MSSDKQKITDCDFFQYSTEKPFPCFEDKCKKNTTDCNHCKMIGDDEWKCTPINQDRPIPCFDDEWKQQKITKEVMNTPYKTADIRSDDNDNCFINHKGICLDKKPANLADPGQDNAPEYYKKDYSDIKQGPNFKYNTDFNCVVRSTQPDESDFASLPRQTSLCNICDSSLTNEPCDEASVTQGVIKDTCDEITDDLIMTTTEVTPVKTKVPCLYYGQSRIDLDRHREYMMKDIYANMNDRHCNPQWK